MKAKSLKVSRDLYPLLTIGTLESGEFGFHMRFAERKLPAWVLPFAKEMGLALVDLDQTGKAHRRGRSIKLIAENALQKHVARFADVPKYDTTSIRNAERHRTNTYIFST